MTTDTNASPYPGPQPDPANPDLRSRLLDAALPHVAFDGWSEETFRRACDDAGVSRDLGRLTCPRGAVDLAVAYHRRGDQRMIARLNEADLTGLRFSEKVARAVRFRIEAGDREAVRRGSTLFALPQHARTGTGLIWDTADAIWTALGDSSEDLNWYTKRATLSAVYGSTVLFWLGDDSLDHAATWDFLDRRIENVMQFEKLKGRVRDNAALKPLTALPGWLASKVRAPRADRGHDMPGRWSPPIDPTRRPGPAATPDRDKVAGSAPLSEDGPVPPSATPR